MKLKIAANRANNIERVAHLIPQLGSNYIPQLALKHPTDRICINVPASWQLVLQGVRSHRNVRESPRLKRKITYRFMSQTDPERMKNIY